MSSIGQFFLDTLCSLDARTFVACTGAGIRVQQAAWSHPGASSHLIGCEFPCSKSQLTRFLGFETSSSLCSHEIAVEMAMSAYIRACEYTIVESDDGRPLGIGLTATVASKTIINGGPRAHLCVISPNKIICESVHLPNGSGVELRGRHEDLLVEMTRKTLENLDSDSFDAGLEPIRAVDASLRNRPRFLGDGRRLHASSPMSVAYLVPENTDDNSTTVVQDLLSRVALIRSSLYNGSEQVQDIEFNFNGPMLVDRAL